MNELFLESKRLAFYKMDSSDFDDIAEMLKNKNVMYAWEYVFSDTEVQDWIDKNTEKYKKYNLGYFIAFDKNLQKVVGQIALMPDTINNKTYLEIGYILKQEFWHKGYTKEGAKAMIDYAFNVLGEKSVIAEIRPMNTASQKVAQSLGMKLTGDFIKKVKDKEMKHLIFTIKNPATQS